MPAMKSLFGHEIDVGVDDFAIITISRVPAEPLMTTLANETVIGAGNAILIRNALEQAGFKLAYSPTPNEFKRAAGR